MVMIFISILVWGFLHTLLASQKVKDRARQVLGPTGNRFYRLGYNVFAAISFLPVLALIALTPDHRLYLVPLPWSVLMVAGEVLAAGMLVVGLMQTDPWEFAGLRQLGDFEGASQLTTRGLYRVVRHPLYSAGMVIIWLLPLMTLNVLVFNLALSGYIVVGAIFEERKLRREFGQKYAEYAVFTPMFIPFLKWNKKKDPTS